FADMRVQPAASPAYFLEVKVGYSNPVLIRHVLRKYGDNATLANDCERLVLVVDTDRREDWPSVLASLKSGLHPKLTLEVWTEQTLRREIFERLGVEFNSLTSHEDLLDVRERLETALGYLAFGGDSLREYRNDPLRAELLWHLGAARLRSLQGDSRKSARDILPPGIYRGVAVLMADLSSFSCFVRDTPDPEIIRESLTAFYSKSRYQVVNGGGMLYQFVGDAVIAFFGVPEADGCSIANSLNVAQSLLDIGVSVSDHWQRRIDRVQAMSGAHIGLTVGDVEILSLRPFSRTRIGAVSDSINMAARLLSAAEPGQIVVSNSFYHKLDEERQRQFAELAPLEAHNVGRVRAWKLDLSSRYQRREA
ncbi:MAG TPA: adenylate/guanylate cyclase domain-containing protein, partial [Lacipirellulaceae bacterium]|nr:adenylate/guanylate cyclase domain-containing protein [Lacipirellulaceae bacterium]